MWVGHCGFLVQSFFIYGLYFVVLQIFIFFKICRDLA